MFQKNEYVIYRRDVCQILDILRQDEKEYYVLVPVYDDSLKIRVPILDTNHLFRRVLSKNEAEDMIHRIPDILPLQNIDDKNIEQEYKALLQDGSLDSFLTIFKTAYLRQEAKKEKKRRVSDTDTYYYELMEKYLFSELSISLNCSVDEVRKCISQIMKELVSVSCT